MEGGSRIALVRAYLHLRYPAGGSTGAPGFPDVGDSWRDLQDRACARIPTATPAEGGMFNATQIKKKCGTLRSNWDCALSPMAASKGEEAVDLADARSAFSFEGCGEIAQLNGSGSLTMCCIAHAEARSLVEVLPDFETSRMVVRSVCNRRAPRSQRYRREIDSFIEVNPTTLEIEET
jgi:hypothetical protein